MSVTDPVTDALEGSVLQCSVQGPGHRTPGSVPGSVTDSQCDPEAVSPLGGRESLCHPLVADALCPLAPMTLPEFMLWGCGGSPAPGGLCLWDPWLRLMVEYRTGSGAAPPPSLGLQLLAVQLGVGESLSAGSGSWGWEGRETPV